MSCAEVGKILFLECSPQMRLKSLFLVLALLLTAAFGWAAVPPASHVVVVLEENHPYSSVIGNSSMPYINSLATKYALSTQYYANTHPSIGNYLMMTAGQIITNNDGYMSTISSDNVVRHLLTMGKTWKSYAESLPSTGYTGGDKYPYIRHHNPLSYFSDVVNSSVQKMNLVSFSHFATDLANNNLPNYSFIVPNQLHNAHDGTLAAADTWLKTYIAPLLANANFMKDGLLIIVFDESYDSDTAYGGGHVATVVIGPQVKRGYRSGTHYQHQNLLKTTLQALGAGSYPGSASSANPMSDLFGTSSGSGGGTGLCTLNTADPSVTICLPNSGSTVGSPVHVTAQATSSVAVNGMQIYVDGVKQYDGKGSTLDTSVSMASGTRRLTVQAYTSTGSVFKTTEYVTVN